MKKIVEKFANYDEDYGEFMKWTLKVVDVNSGDTISDIVVNDMSDTPEDATLSMGLSFVNEITSLMKLAYAMGKHGEDVQFIYEEDEK
ncbi:hypothetical protein SAMN05216454_1419 [Peptostreptococcus russellii]|uniref:Uncharacterized protein n=1 Tax=Peptostreptococcus russellii TaxID=215200 RepID=A0A1H8KRS7_9FIRM|nr:hypothetical protein [Peptostreptococcus russellii]SEN95589.1 hypothetical protein SAMN05216454_1419 [Peptostreptococcus russellii]